MFKGSEVRGSTLRVQEFWLLVSGSLLLAQTRSSLSQAGRLLWTIVQWLLASR